MTDLPAGDFVSWLVEIRDAIEGEGTTDVPCGTCVACCSSSQFIHIAPDERDALDRIPKALLFPAPRMPRGHVLMGYDEHGRCPMLRESGCSIYEHRPRTCRTYDCRVFPAAGVLPDEPDKVLIATQAARWQFTFDDADATMATDAIRAAAIFLRDHRGDLGEVAAHTTTHLAVDAIRVHDLFVHGQPQVAEVAVRLTSRRR
ncbi:MAG TPA: YkgJ family cysteine cluster protein [Ilumatobacteraceae bacterium]|nr:YkgJ family cysteine cluster protein [Ilumatobacteraceae bacterium]HRB04050.1 YkgJ family cysteine cluster protein [Ilumatobacteraceae bacterium]